MMPASAARVIFALLLCVVAGCASRRASTSSPSTAPDRRPGLDLPPTPSRHEVAILFNNAPGYSEVTTELKKLLPSETYQLMITDVEAADLRSRIAALRRRPGLFVVAVGLPAARIARDQLTAPIVFAQIFNYQELLVKGRLIRGVAAMPPLDLQIQDWKKLDSKLQRVGLIVSKEHAALIPEAERAGKSAGITIQHDISDSDRETLYMFKRLAPQIDGLWLVPDERILSPTTLRELLAYAVSHNVRVCVFSDPLLSWGALLSASPTPGDIARTVRRVLESMMAGDTNALPTLTPLSEVAIRINEQVAGRFGLSAPPRASWVVRGEQ
jgi:ABC-type uncharacterized transport system substrate-binding protein